MLTGSELDANSAPDSLTPKCLNFVRVAEQVEGVDGADEVAVDGLAVVSVPPELELTGKH